MRYLNTESTRKYRLTTLAGEDAGSPSGKFLFVNRVDEPQVLRVVSKAEINAVGGAGHTSLAMSFNANGKVTNHDVYVAGEAWFDGEGYLERWDVSSGHYLPNEEYFRCGPVPWLNDILPPQKFTG